MPGTGRVPPQTHQEPGAPRRPRRPSGGPEPTATTAVSDETDDDPGAVEETDPAKPSLAKLIKFERENAIPTSTWWKHVTGRKIRSGALWIYTDYPATSNAKATAKGICASYAHYALDDPTVSVVDVRAEDGGGLATCGPGA
jgi:hypothetical protein